MGFDWNTLFDNGKAEISKAFDNVVKTGVPAIQAAAEKTAIDWLQKQNQSTQATLNANVKEILSEPSSDSAFSKSLKEAVSTPIFQQYGVYMIGGVVLLLVAGAYLKGK